MNPYVLVWTLVSATGVFLSILLLIESVRDLNVLRGVGNGRVLHVRGRLASEAIRLVIHGMFCLAGITALDSPVAATGPSLVVVILITGNVLLIVKSVIAWYVRRAAGYADIARAEASLEAEAISTALALRQTADQAAARLVELATLTANIHGDRVTSAAERTAENTERIAENTDPTNGFHGRE